jgi:hypothetical protein
MCTTVVVADDRFVHRFTKRIELLSVNPGSQAERHTQLKPGALLSSVAGVAVHGKEYADVLELIKNGSRPLTMSFAPPGKVSPLARGQSMDKKSPTASGALQPGRARMVLVRFTAPGPLGVKFVSRGGMVIVLSVSEGECSHLPGTHIVKFRKSLLFCLCPCCPGSQASAHTELRPGLTVVAVDRVPVQGKSYADVIDMIRRSGRPFDLELRAGGAPAVQSGMPENPILANAMMQELMKWLDTRGVGQYAGGVRDAFVREKISPEQWVVELEDMDDQVS